MIERNKYNNFTLIRLGNIQDKKRWTNDQNKIKTNFLKIKEEKHGLKFEFSLF